MLSTSSISWLWNEPRVSKRWPTRKRTARREAGLGQHHTYLAMEPTSKLILAHHTGRRTWRDRAPGEAFDLPGPAPVCTRCVERLSPI
jgi:hypothetical protein